MNIINQKKGRKKQQAFATKKGAVDISFTTATTSTSVALTKTGFGKIVIPISTEIAFKVSLTNRVLNEIIMNK